MTMNKPDFEPIKGTPDERIAHCLEYLAPATGQMIKQASILSNRMTALITELAKSRE